MNCVNLREQFGERFRIEYDEAHRGRGDDPWLQVIPCLRGHIYPHGGELLGIATNSRGATAAALARLAGVVVVQDGDDGINATFPVAMFGRVAALVRPKRRRRLSAERREGLVSIGTANLETYRNAKAQSSFAA